MAAEGPSASFACQAFCLSKRLTIGTDNHVAEDPCQTRGNCSYIVKLSRRSGTSLARIFRPMILLLLARTPAQRTR